MFGQLRHEEINSRLNNSLAQQNPIVAVHRGTGLGSIAENTQAAVIAAVRQGARMVEFDVVRSTDGDFFLFHEGYEAMHFGFEERLGTLTGEQIRKLRYRWNSDEPYGVTPLADVLNTNQDTLFNVDRSWWYWDTLLPYLDEFATDGRVVLKCPAVSEWLGLLAAHPVKYALVPMVRTHQEVLDVLAWDGINTVGFELIAPNTDHEFAGAEYFQWLRSKGLLVFVNALTMQSRKPMFCGWDDETSVVDGPEHGWDRLVEIGADIIQTDWPGLLVGRLRESAAQASSGQRQ